MSVQPLPAFEALSLVLHELASPLFLISMEENLPNDCQADAAFDAWFRLRSFAAEFEARESVVLSDFARHQLFCALADAHSLTCADFGAIPRCSCRAASMLRWVSRVLAGEEVARAIESLEMAGVGR